MMRDLRDGAFGMALIFITAAFSLPAEAGWLFSPGVRWQTFSFQPEKKEPTPNYQGYGATVRCGYSISQRFDLAVFGDYTPATLKLARPPDRDDAQLSVVGGEFGLRLFRSVYLAGRVGSLDYRLLKQHKPEELEGRWTGMAYGGSFGALFSITKEHYWQTAIDLMSVSEMKKTGAGAHATLRKFDTFSVTLSYVFNSFSNNALDDTMFGRFIGGMWN